MKAVEHNIGAPAVEREAGPLAFVDGTDAGLELIKAGLAWAYEYYLPEVLEKSS